jgi:hypothetical protein
LLGEGRGGVRCLWGLGMLKGLRMGVGVSRRERKGVGMGMRIVMSIHRVVVRREEEVEGGDGGEVVREAVRDGLLGISWFVSDEWFCIYISYTLYILLLS